MKGVMMMTICDFPKLSEVWTYIEDRFRAHDKLLTPDDLDIPKLFISRYGNRRICTADNGSIEETADAFWTRLDSRIDEVWYRYSQVIPGTAQEVEAFRRGESDIETVTLKPGPALATETGYITNTQTTQRQYTPGGIDRIDALSKRLENMVTLYMRDIASGVLLGVNG